MGLKNREKDRLRALYKSEKIVHGKIVSKQRRFTEKIVYKIEIPVSSNKKNTSANIITWNEEELLPYCLEYLLSLPQIGEICIVDSFSTDGTMDVIENYKKMLAKRDDGVQINVTQKEFTSFSDQRNECLRMSKFDWILYIDADETYTNHLIDLLPALDLMPTINAVRINTITLFPDRFHFIKSNNLDPHIRIWRRGYAKFESNVHESLKDRRGRSLHSCADGDILDAVELFPNIFMKHGQLLKSENCLLEKGERWEKINAIEESIKKGLPIYKKIWFDWKNGQYEVEKLPEELYDITTR